MSIAEFIRESVLRPRLKQAGALVVYDAEKRYREQCFDLAADKVRVIDASISSIESREAALLALREVGQPKAPLEGVLIYVPAKRPETDEQKQVDPFALYAECGAVFPQDDGDEYLSLCLRAKPDHATEIRQVFSGSPVGPTFAVIDAIGGGVSWPQLRATLRVESGREILAALLAPSISQSEALKGQEGWVQEAHDFLRATLGLNVKTRGKTWSALADELWRYVLFSEFVFDLPVALPEALKGVPHARMPKLDGATVSNVAQRMSVLTKRYGDRFAEMSLNDFVRGKPKISETVDLLVLRSTEIDSQLESNPETTLGLIPGTLKLIRVALHRLRGMRFKEAIIVTDHGFFLNAQAEAGDVCIKPQGKWRVNAHDRMMLGDGTADGHSLVVSAEKVGIRGDFTQVALPRSMAPYRSGHLYFHGGASLAEAVVPVLISRLDTAAHADLRKVVVELSYKNGAKRITTRLPVIEVILIADDMFLQDTSVEILLEAQDSKGNVVGELRPGGDVNPATRTVTLMPNQRKQIALRMDEEFRGKFKVLALNPATLAAYSNLALETDYTE